MLAINFFIPKNLKFEDKSRSKLEIVTRHAAALIILTKIILWNLTEMNYRGWAYQTKHLQNWD
jgi:hypothetical protein